MPRPSLFSLPGAARPAGAGLVVLAMSFVPAAGNPSVPADSTAGETMPTFTLEPVEVHAERLTPVARTLVSPAMTSLPPVADGGDFLRLLPGITGGRMGGHGIEPVIRGQQQTQLNVLVDGAFVYGGCPNRMDPPSAISNFDTADRVTVMRGKQSLIHGAGGPGGTVLIEHLPPAFAPGRTLAARVSPAYESNGEGVPAWADLALHRADLYARATARHRDVENYTAGDGREVRSAFAQSGGSLALGWSGDLADRDGADFLELAAEFDRTDDALFAGSGMDAPRSETWAGRLRGRRAVSWGPVTAVRGDLFASDVDHEMDNFTLRPLESGFRRAVTESRTLGGRLLAEMHPRGLLLTAGADFQRQMKDADRFGNNTDPADVTAVQAILWPDLVLQQLGLFVEGQTSISARARLIAGLRFDRIDFSAGRADEAPTLATMGMTRTPNDLYRTFYGVGTEDAAENNLSGLVRVEIDPAPAILLSAGVSRTLRTADPTERALANEMAAMSWVGNPGLRPEKHYQLDLGAAVRRAVWTAGLSLYADRVDDYIFRDAARGQEGVLVDLPQADVYRNIGAVLAGAELEAGWIPATGWRIDVDATYTFGENLEIDGPLAQIPPLLGRLAVRRARVAWELGARLNAAARQTRVDLDPLTGSGRDVRRTPGYATVDLFGSLAWRDGISLRAGVSNLLDRAYANHLNRENGVDNEVLQVHEPGRAFHLRLVAEL